MQFKTEEQAVEYEQKVRGRIAQLFNSELGREVLDDLVEMYVFRGNDTASPVIEGERLLVLELRDIADGEYEIDIGEDTDAG